MIATKIQDTLQEEIATLPDKLAVEVLDFVLFLKERHAEDDYLGQQIEATKAYDAQHPEEVITVTAEEFAAMTAYMEDEA